MWKSAVKHAILAGALSAVYFEAQSDIDQVSLGVDQRLYNHARLEEAAKLEPEIRRFTDAARSFVEGDSTVEKGEVDLAFDLVWSRAKTLATAGTDNSADQAIQKADFLPGMLAGLAVIDKTVDGLDRNDAEGLRRILAAMRPLAISAEALGTAANSERLKHHVAFSESQIVLASRLSRLQLNYLLIGLIALAVFLIEIADAARLNRKLKAQEADIRRVAERDGLTGVANRHSLDLCFASLERERRSGNCQLMLIDLDHFKEINDRFGHNAGDKLLRTFAERLCRAAPPGATVARFGGDEFAILMNGDAQDGARVAENIVAMLREPVAIDGGEVLIGASIGIASCSTPGFNSQVALHRADTALYGVKKSGRDSYRFFDEQLFEADAGSAASGAPSGAAALQAALNSVFPAVPVSLNNMLNRRRGDEHAARAAPEVSASGRVHPSRR